jgi:hypothetical protein
MNTDRIFGVSAKDPESMRKAMYLVLSRLQDEPEVQLQGTAMCLFVMCRACGIDIRQLLTSMERMVNDTDNPFSVQIPALETYAREQVRRHVNG